MTKHFIPLVIASLLMAALAGCGGDAAKPNPGVSSIAPASHTFHVPAKVEVAPAPAMPQHVPIDEVQAGVSPQGGWPAATRGASAVPGLEMSQIPPLPPAQPSTAAQRLKHASTVYNLDLSIPFATGGGASVGIGTLSLTSSADSLAWAIYEQPLDIFEYPQIAGLQLTMDAQVNGADSGVWIGLSNYTAQRWEFFGPHAGNINLNYPALGLFKNGSNNAYILVLTWNGDAATLTMMGLTSVINEPPPLPDEWTTALTNVGLGPGTPGMEDVFGPGLTSDTFGWVGFTDLATKLPGYWDHWYGDPSQGAQYMKDKNNALRDATSLQQLMLNQINEFPEDKRITAQTHSETLDATHPLAVAVSDFVTAAGGLPDLPTYVTALDPMSIANQNALAPLFYAAKKAMELRRDSLIAMGFDATNLPDFFSWSHGDPLGGILLLRTESYVPAVWDVTGGNFLLRGFDYPPFFEGGCYIADVIDDLTAYMATSPTWEDVSLNVSTPVGAVVIGGLGDDNHAAPVDGNGHAILIDLGGGDTYNCNAGGTASYLNGVSLCIDLGGNDIYRAMDDPTDVDRTALPPNDNTSQQGAGRFGIGMLIDYGGSDQYVAVRLSQGSCVFGVGVLADYGTDGDAYEMEALGEGGAFAGIALLVDHGGTDQYKCWQKCQGFGSLMGVGYLVDYGTDTDNYFAQRNQDVTKPEYYSTDYSTNMSMCQGAGWGARWGWLNFNSTDEVGGGGLGVLFDGGGDDSYECGTFGQGFGFYQSVGLLLDEGGDDVHTGHWYTQGASAHVAVGMLRDGGGDDEYTNDVSIGVGGAHDWSITWFYELSGDEIYNGANLGLASGYSNGFAYFLDLAGNDSYSCQGANENTTLGKGNLGDADRPDMPSYGILLDLSGNDTYHPIYQNMTQSTGLPGNGQSWIRTVDGTYVNGKGSGLDI